MAMVVSPLLLPLLVADDLLPLLHPVHGGGHLLDAHLGCVQLGTVALPSTLVSFRDDFLSSLRKASGRAPASLLLDGVDLHGGHLLDGVPLLLCLLEQGLLAADVPALVLPGGALHHCHCQVGKEAYRP